MCLDPAEEVVPKEQYILFEKEYVPKCDTNEEGLSVDERYSGVLDFNKLQMWQDNNVLQIYEKMSKFYP